MNKQGTLKLRDALAFILISMFLLFISFLLLTSFLSWYSRSKTVIHLEDELNVKVRKTIYFSGMITINGEYMLPLLYSDDHNFILEYVDKSDRIIKEKGHDFVLLIKTDTTLKFYYPDPTD